MFTFCKSRWARREKIGKKITQLNWLKYQKPKDKNGMNKTFENLGQQVVHSNIFLFILTWKENQFLHKLFTIYGFHSECGFFLFLNMTAILNHFANCIMETRTHVRKEYNLLNPYWFCCQYPLINYPGNSNTKLRFPTKA